MVLSPGDCRSALPEDLGSRRRARQGPVLAPILAPLVLVHDGYGGLLVDPTRKGLRRSAGFS